MTVSYTMKTNGFANSHNITNTIYKYSESENGKQRKSIKNEQYMNSRKQAFNIGCRQKLQYNWISAGRIDRVYLCT